MRAISFSHDSAYIASGSEDSILDISNVATGEHAHAINVNAAVNTVAWHPSRHVLALAGDEKDRMHRDAGNVRVYALAPS